MRPRVPKGTGSRGKAMAAGPGMPKGPVPNGRAGHVKGTRPQWQASGGGRG